MQHRNFKHISLSPIVLLILLPCLYAYRVKAGESLCRRHTSDKEAAPPFLCQYNVTFMRNPDCSAVIVETMVFPHTTGRNVFRVIPLLTDFQHIFNITLQREAETIDLSRTDENNEVRIEMPTMKSTSPVIFKLTYSLSNAVMKAKRTCGSVAEEDEKKTVMRWMSGDWDKSFDTLLVRFETKDQNSKLFVIGKNRSLSQEVYVLKRNVDGNVEIYAGETGASACPSELDCFSNKSGDTAELEDMLYYFLVGFLAIFAPLCICLEDDGYSYFIRNDDTNGHERRIWDRAYGAGYGSIDNEYGVSGVGG